jgi:bisphosphoglycerate-independent phosphoglycerate mutase (AlkP superfamily)
MGTLYFIDSKDNKRKISERIAETEVYTAITKFISGINPNFRIYYVRTWKPSEKTVMYDVGSHTEFFAWEEDEDDNT